MYRALKILILFSALVAVNAKMSPQEYGEWLEEKSEKLHKLCVDITGANEEQIEQLSDGIFPEDLKLKRYVLCFLRASKVLMKNFQLDTHLLQKVLPEKNKKDLFDMRKRCMDLGRNSDHQEMYEKTYVYIKCLYEANPEDFIMF